MHNGAQPRLQNMVHDIYKNIRGQLLLVSFEVPSAMCTGQVASSYSEDYTSFQHTVYLGN